VKLIKVISFRQLPRSGNARESSAPYVLFAPVLLTSTDVRAIISKLLGTTSKLLHERCSPQKRRFLSRGLRINLYPLLIKNSRSSGTFVECFGRLLLYLSGVRV